MKSRIRINKYLSLCGMGSRRKVEDYILSGRIKINGSVDKSLHTMVNINSDTVELDNKRLNPLDELFYIILNKPRGYITTLSDERARPIVMDLIPEKYKKAFVFPVGRLDKDTEGLLLLTNDGDLAYCLTHPKFGVSKEYIVKLDKPLRDSDRSRIEKGIYIDGHKTNPAVIEFPGKTEKLVKMTITEGKKRQVRLTFSSLSYNVKKLKRVSFGPLVLGEVKSGEYRLLNDKEIKVLKNYQRIVKSG